MGEIFAMTFAAEAYINMHDLKFCACEKGEIICALLLYFEACHACISFAPSRWATSQQSEGVRLIRYSKYSSM